VKVSAQEEYGLRFMLQLARRQIGGYQEPLTLGEIGRHEGLTIPHVAKLIRKLRTAGLVRSALGRRGGYMLARGADSISVAEILHALGGRLYDPEYCDRYTGDLDTCTHVGDCAIRSLWGVLETLLEGVLSKTRLSEMVRNECGMTAVLDGRSADASQDIGGRR
jgi:Rrf2 family protein